MTGDTGFKGGWLVFWLNQLGAEVIGYALEPPSTPSLYEALCLRKIIKHVTNDVRDGDALEKAARKYRPEIIFHMAAQPLVRSSYLEPKTTYETNVLGTVNLLEAVRKIEDVRACVVVTSDKCYKNRGHPRAYQEDDPLGGFDPYSSSKACAELVVAAYRQSFFMGGMEARNHYVGLATVRAGNVIGGGDWGEDRIVPDCIRALSQGRDVEIRNPHSVRPWQYVLEPLYGYLVLGSMLYRGIDMGGAWNFGPSSSELFEVKDLVELVIKEWGEGKYRIAGDKKGLYEVDVLQLDASKATALLNWRLRYSIHEAVRRTVSWYRQFYSGATTKKMRQLTLEEISVYQTLAG